jgi:CheY-like chemotaxis protein
VLLRNIAVLRLANSNQAPWAFFYAGAQFREILCRDAQVFNRFPDIIVISAHHSLHARDQALGLFHGGMHLEQILAKRFPELIDGRVVPFRLTGQGTVLVVDDEPVVRKIAANSLQRYGYTVMTAENGREGLERFRELLPQLRLVILDMTMPVMSGEEALEKMLQIDSRIPIVMSSGYNELEAMSRFAGKGVAGFLQKPYTIATLGEKVRKVLREAEDVVTPRN